MICKNCQKEIEDGSSFCIFCGANQEEAVAPAAPEPVEEQPKKKKGCLIAAIIAIVAVVLVGTILLVAVAGVAVVSYFLTKPVEVQPAHRYEDVWEGDIYYEKDEQVGWVEAPACEETIY